MKGSGEVRGDRKIRETRGSGKRLNEKMKEVAAIPFRQQHDGGKRSRRARFVDYSCSVFVRQGGIAVCDLSIRFRCPNKHTRFDNFVDKAKAHHCLSLTFAIVLLPQYQVSTSMLTCLRQSDEEGILPHL